MLLVFFRRWGWLVMCNLIKHDALLWLLVFSTALIGAFRSSLFTQWFSPSALHCRTALLLLCFWSWESMLLEFLFHYPCWCCSGEVRAVEKSTNHSRASCFIRLHMTSRPHRLKKTKNMQSKHRDLHHMWLHRETNEKLSFHSIFTGCCNSNAENSPSGSTWQNPQEA